MADLPPLFVPVSVGRTVDIDGGRRPTVVIDAEGRPDVADLARVHAVEGIGDVKTIARRIAGPEGDLVLLGVSMTRPVRAAFAIGFDLDAHRGFLTEVADAGELVVATTDPDSAGDEQPLWLAVDIDGQALVAALG